MIVHSAALGFDDIVIAAPSDCAPDKRLAFMLSTSLATRMAQPGPSTRVAGESRSRELARMHPGELLYVPSRGWELVRAWRAYRSGARG